MGITGTTRVFFILGDPVAQVRAPEVYNHLFQRHGIDAVLVPLKLPAAALPGFVEHGMRCELDHFGIDVKGRRVPVVGAGGGGHAVAAAIAQRAPATLLRACRARSLQAEAGFEMLVQQIPESLRFFRLRGDRACAARRHQRSAHIAPSEMT